MESRREFLRKVIIFGGMLTFSSNVSAYKPIHKHEEETLCSLYRTVNGTPDQNLSKVIGMMGGIEKLIGPVDMVVIKPNVQWWNQGAPNLLALKTFVDKIMERPGGFRGEVIIAENCHRGKTPWTSIGSGWAYPFNRNSDIQGIRNMNDLCGLLKKKYGSRFSTVHWVDVASGGRKVFSPGDGVGCVYRDGTGGVPLLKCSNGLSGNNFRETIMTYPIFKTDKGTIIDFKNGIWERGSYTEQPLRFINFSALNHHSTYCGATSAIKNYLGITDLSGGPDPHNGGRLTEKYYNFHSFPFDKWAPGPEPGMLGKEVGTFMKTIRKADINFATAEWVGLSSRTDPPVAHTRAVLACTDPVALDYHAAKYILFPNSRLSIHNPDNRKGPLYPILAKCAETMGGTLDEDKVEVKSYDFRIKSFQQKNNLVIDAPISWGTNPRAVLKYLVLRYWNKS